MNTPCFSVISEELACGSVPLLSCFSSDSLTTLHKVHTYVLAHRFWWYLCYLAEILVVSVIFGCDYHCSWCSSNRSIHQIYLFMAMPLCMWIVLRSDSHLMFTCPDRLQYCGVPLLGFFDKCVQLRSQLLISKRTTTKIGRKREKKRKREKRKPWGASSGMSAKDCFWQLKSMCWSVYSPPTQLWSPW